MIEIKHICAGYSGTEVLHDLNLTIESGKVTVIIGPNGGGKSTLLKSLIRLNPHTSGDILIEDKNIDTFSSSMLAQKIAYIPQSRKTPDISVLRMVLHGRFPYLTYPRRYRKEDYEAAKNAMRCVGIENLADKNVSTLSGGTQQKVYIAMALAQDTPVILMDEPTVYLDIAHQLRMMTTAKQLAAQGKAVVMILHDFPQAFAVADEIIVMSEGRIVSKGSPEQVYQTGTIESVFNIHFSRVHTSNGWKYFCE